MSLAPQTFRVRPDSMFYRPIGLDLCGSLCRWSPARLQRSLLGRVDWTVIRKHCVWYRSMNTATNPSGSEFSDQTHCIFLRFSNHPAGKFLNRLDPTDPLFVFQIFRNDRPGIGRIFRGTWENNGPELIRLNRQGWDVFVTVNQAVGREKTNVQQCRTLFQEDDDCGIAPPLKPHIVVNTSPSHFHRYWLHTPVDYPSVEWDKAQKAMATRWGSDPNAIDASRVLRLPGFWNHKRGCLCTLVELNSDLDPYTWEDLPKLLGLDLAAEPDPADKSKSSGGLDEYLRQIAAGEHLHGPIRALMMINANNGLDALANEMVCKGLIYSWTGETVRRDKALADLPSMIKATYVKIAGETEEEQNQRVTKPVDLTKIEQNKDLRFEAILDRLPTRMRQFYNAAYDSTDYPHKRLTLWGTLFTFGSVMALSAALTDSNPIYPRMYVKFVGPTVSGKDYMLKVAQKVMLAQEKPTWSKPGSGAGLEDYVLSGNGVFIGIYDEKSEHSIVTDVNNNDFIDRENALWSACGSSYKRRPLASKNGDIRPQVDQVFYAKLAASTEVAHFGEGSRERGQKGGTSRTIVIFPDSNRPKAQHDPQPFTLHETVEFKHYLDRLAKPGVTKISLSDFHPSEIQTSFSVSLERDARELIWIEQDRIDSIIRETSDEVVRAVIGRAIEYVKILSLVIARSRDPDTTVVSVQDAELAILIMQDYATEALVKVVDNMSDSKEESNASKLVKKVKELLQKKITNKEHYKAYEAERLEGWITEPYLRNRGPKLTPKEWQDAIEYIKFHGLLVVKCREKKNAPTHKITLYGLPE